MKHLFILAVCFLFVIAAGTAFCADQGVTGETCGAFLKAMKLNYKSPAQNTLTFRTGFPDSRQYDIICVADPKNKFVYMAVLDLKKLDGASPKVCEITRKMATLNYGMVMTKLEWNEKAGEVRMSITLSTEDGLSEKRFGVALTTLLLSAEQADKRLQ